MKTSPKKNPKKNSKNQILNFKKKLKESGIQYYLKILKTFKKIKNKR